MKTWHSLAIAVSTFGIYGVAQADMLGVYGSVDYWHVQGEYNEVAKGRSMNDANELDLKDKGQAQLAVSFEHPIPLVPNARIRHVTINAETKDQTALGNKPTYDIKLNNTDFILYYELLDNIVSADVGIAAKRLDGHVDFNGLTGTDSNKISKTAPMLYASAAASLPFTGLSAKAEALYTNYSNTEITDASAEIKYDFIDNLVLDVGAKAGYRILDMKLDKQGDFDTKFRFTGPYIGLEAHF